MLMYRLLSTLKLPHEVATTGRIFKGEDAEAQTK